MINVVSPNINPAKVDAIEETEKAEVRSVNPIKLNITQELLEKSYLSIFKCFIDLLEKYKE